MKVIMSGNVMSGSRRLGPACLLSVAGSTHWSVQPTDEKFLWKTTSIQTVVSCLCWCVKPHIFFTPFAGPTKGWIIVFLPWGGPQVGNPPLVAACVSISAEACCCWWWSLSSSSYSKETSKLLASVPDSESLSATRISLMTCSSVLFFSVHWNRHLQLPALFTRVCKTGTVMERSAT